MELLDLLEQRVTELLAEVAVLRKENRALEDEVASGQHKVEEIAALQAELARERALREEAGARVNAILRRIQSGLEEK